MDYLEDALFLLQSTFVIIIGFGAALVVGLYFFDRFWSHDAIERNYPVLGRFRELFTKLGEFFRQYFFAMDREELPFNRAQRDWVKRVSDDRINNMIAFGSTRNLEIPGTPIFVNSAFPPLDEEASPAPPLMIGSDARQPYVARSIFNISGMSYGAISKPAVRALSHGAAKAGIWMNTGEGGVSPFHLESGCDLVYQIGTAKYGVRDEDGNLDDGKLRDVASHEQIKMFEIKVSQGAKPGKGGILPAAKINEEIAAIRGIPMGKASYSPNRHAEVHNWDELLDFIVHVREVTGKPVGIKLCIGSPDGVRPFFEAILRRGADTAPDFITIDGGEGGTGASPMPLIDLAGISIREALPRMVDIMLEYGLRERIKVIASGKLITSADVAWAMAAGADFVVSGRGFMFALGCIQALKCNKNTCPTGITTHSPGLQKGLIVGDKIERVSTYARELVSEVEVIAHACGVENPRQMERKHVRLVQPNGRSKRMDALFPYPENMHPPV